MGLNKCLMTCIHHYNIIWSSFIALKSHRAPCIHPSLPRPLVLDTQCPWGCDSIHASSAQPSVHVWWRPSHLLTPLYGGLSVPFHGRWWLWTLRWAGRGLCGNFVSPWKACLHSACYKGYKVCDAVWQCSFTELHHLPLGPGISTAGSNSNNRLTVSLVVLSSPLWTWLHSWPQAGRTIKNSCWAPRWFLREFPELLEMWVKSILVSLLKGMRHSAE